MLNRAIFFDRDGVLNKLVKRDGGYYSPLNFKNFKINEEAKSITNDLKRLNYLNIVISNQPEIARNRMKSSELEKMTEYLKNEIIVDDIFYCTHDDNSNCACRKPKTGLFLNAQKKWNIDLHESFFVGDTWRDLDAGKNMNLKTIILENNCNYDLKCDIKIKKLKDLLSIIKNEFH